MGVLVLNHVAKDYPNEHEFWDKLIIDIHPIGKDWSSSADSSKMWFFPVENWGDKIALSIDRRAADGKRLSLLQKTTITVKEGMWPYVLEIPTK